MRALVRFAALAVMLVAFPLISSAQAPPGLVGTWKQNVAKSTYTTGAAPKSQTARYEAVPGGGLKIVGDIVDAAGKATHTELVTMLDGKEAERKGAEQPTTRAYTRIDDRTIQYVQRVNGKVTQTSRQTMSADGKTRTNVNTDAAGKPISTTVFERQ
ncbi:MAG: hypothetical protein ABL982_22760 [Vicinamibacterales bacterium]